MTRDGLRAVTDEDAELWVGLMEGLSGDAGSQIPARTHRGGTKQPAAGTSERRWMSFPADEDQVDPLIEVVEGLIVAGSNGLAGYPKTGKSLIAAGLGQAIAGGMSHYLGRRILQHGDVLHVYLEGTRGVPGRSRAFETQYAGDLAVDRPGQYRVWPHPVDLRQSEDVLELVNSLPEAAAPPVLVILDTLAASFPGLRGNEEDEKVLAYMRFEQMVSGLGATAGLMVSHTGHADRGREMGSVAGIGRLDNALVALRDEKSGHRTLKVSMSRDMADSGDTDLAYSVLGVPNSARAADGQLSRSGPVVVEGHAPTDWAGIMGNAASPQSAVLGILRPVLEADGYADSPASMNALYETLEGHARRPSKTVFLAACSALAAAGELVVTEGPRRAKLVALPEAPPVPVQVPL